VSFDPRQRPAQGPPAGRATQLPPTLPRVASREPTAHKGVSARRLKKDRQRALLPERLIAPTALGPVTAILATCHEPFRNRVLERLLRLL